MSWINRDTLINKSLLVVSIIFSLFVAEILLRITIPSVGQVGPSDGVSDPVLGFTLVPNSTGGVDANGFRNKKLLSDYDLVALGDSHTEGGYGVTWPEYLSQLSGKTIYNMGIRGYGPAQYYYLLDKALSFHPKTVIVGFYIGNDILDAYNATYHLQGWDEFRSKNFIDDQIESEFIKPVIHLKGIRDFIRKKSFLYKFLSQRTRTWRERLGITIPRTIGVHDWNTNNPEISLIFDSDSQIKTIFWPGGRIKGTDMEDKNVVEGLRLSKLYISLMKQKVSKKSPGTDLIFILIPSRFASYEKVVANSGENNKFFSQIIENERQVRTELLTYCVKEKIRCIDILPDLQNTLGNGIKIYSENIDDHPVKLGYKKYAEFIFKGINQ